MQSFREYVTENFELDEGNPLARLHTHIENDRHFATITAVRSNLSNAENNARMKEFKGKLKAQGYGFKKSKGVWEGGHENSLTVYAKKPGDAGGEELKRDMTAHSTHYGQDAYMHHNGREAKLIGTNDTGSIGRGNTVPIGKIHYNQDTKKYPDRTELKKTATFTARN